MPTDFCPYCGEWGCDGECEADGDQDICEFCGEWWCDGSGYNCLDEYYQTYNEGQIVDVVE